MCRYESFQLSLERPLLYRSHEPLNRPEALVTFTDWRFAARFAVSRAVISRVETCLATANPARAPNPMTHRATASSARFKLDPSVDDARRGSVAKRVRCG